MLQLKDVSIIYKKDLRELVSGLSLVLNPGDKAALIGEEGNGKSTLLKLIYDRERVEDYIEFSGEIIANGHVAGYLEQEMSKRERELSAYEYLTSEPCFYDMGDRELAGMASQLGLPVDMLYSEQKTDTLSGGEKVKLQMIRILCRRPDILLLDEPSNDLDLDTLKWLEDFICNWEGVVLFVSHDETLLERTANRIIHLEMLRKKQKPRHTVSNTGYEEYVSNRRRQMEKQEQIAKKERSEQRARQERLARIEQKVERQQERITRQDPHGAALLKKKMKSVKSMEHRFERESADMTELPEAEEAIFFRFHESGKIPRTKTVLHLENETLWAGERLLAGNINLDVRGPEKICIVGKNGVGKTTLLKRIASQLMARDDIRAEYMPQNYEDKMDFDQTPVSFLSRTGDRQEETKIRTFLGSLKFTGEEMDHPVRELSGGQKAKLYLLGISMGGANVLILDEPTRNFSPLSNPVIRRMLKNFEGAIISVSHDRKYMSEVCDARYELTDKGCLRLPV